MTKAELLELLKKARKQLKKYHVPKDEQTVTLSIDTLENALSEQPEIVRCKDCKHATMTADGKMCKYCAMDTDDFGDQRDVYHDADWYCTDGERQEGR